MALNAPTNFDATYETMARDAFIVTLWWDEVPGAAYYNLYRENAVYKIEPPYDTKIVDGSTRICYRDTAAWFQGQSMDMFYWVAAVEAVTGTDGVVTYVEGTMSDALTNLHPFGLRVVEEARSLIGDDLRVFNDVNDTIQEQISVYNYKIAMDQALSTINSTPTFTNYTYGTIPHQFKSLLTIGTIAYVLPKLILLERAKGMQFQDQGQTWTPPELATTLEKLKEDYKKDFDDRRKEIKHNVRPYPMAVGSYRAMYISPQMLRFRHIQSGRPVF